MQKPHVHTIWGKGVSQGHTEALRGIKGVRRALAFTIPNSAAVTALMQSRITPTREELHTRLCVVVADECDRKNIEESIRSFPDYFAPYKCEVNFVSEEEFDKNYASICSHRGQIISSGLSGVYGENYTRFNAELQTDSNPQLTAGILLASAIATYRLNKEKRYGAFTPLDVPPSYFLSDRNYFEFI